MSIYTKLLDAKKDIGKISKDSTNPFFKSRYFDINQLLEHVEPVLQNHGLLLLQPIEDQRVRSVIYDAETSENVCSEIHLEDYSDPQKLGSAITYYRRYTLQSLLGLQAEDDDGNKASQNPPPIPPQNNNKPWLNETHKQSGEPTKDWINIEVKIQDGTISNISEIEQHYKISKATRSNLEKLFNV